MKVSIKEVITKFRFQMVRIFESYVTSVYWCVLQDYAFTYYSLSIKHTRGYNVFLKLTVSLIF